MTLLDWLYGWVKWDTAKIRFDEKRLNALEDDVSDLQKKVSALMSKVDDLEAAVAAEDTVIDSVVVLVDQLAQMVKDAGTDPVRLQAVIDTITAKKQAIADAVIRNTPATP